MVGGFQSRLSRAAALNLMAKLNVQRNFHHDLSAIDRSLPFCPSFLAHPLLKFGGSFHFQVHDVMQVFAHRRVHLRQIITGGA